MTIKVDAVAGIFEGTEVAHGSTRESSDIAALASLRHRACTRPAQEIAVHFGQARGHNVERP
jgi:hypothetical protein